MKIVNRPNFITSKQLIFFLIAAQIGSGVLSLPRLAAMDAGQDGWIAALIGAIVPIISLFMIEWACRRVPAKGFVEMNYMLFGKMLGTLLVSIFVAHILLFAAIVARLTSIISHIYLLPQTPLAVLIFLNLLFVLYICNKGGTVVARINELVFYLLLFLIPVLLAPSYFVGDYTNLLPVGEAGFMELARTLLSTAYSYGGSEILMVLYWMVSRKEEVIKAGMTAIGLTALAYASVTIGCILVFGVDRLRLISWPLLLIMKTVQLPVIERLDVFFLMTWVVIGVRPVINMTFSGAYTLNQLLNIDMNKYFNYVIIAAVVVVFIITQLFVDILQLYKWATYIGISSIIMQLLYPLLMLVAVLLRREEIKQIAA